MITTTAPMAPSLDTPDDRITDEASKAPEVFFNASSANNAAFKRSPGLILTREQIISLKKYELAGLALPIELSQVIAYLGYPGGAGPGLEPEDFLKSFTLIHKHARRWRPLRTRLQEVGSNLKVFAGQMAVYGQSMEDINSDIKGGNVIDELGIKTVADLHRLQREMGDSFPGIELSGDDAETVRDVRRYLDEILQKVNERHRDAQNIKEELDTFGLDLAQYVAPEIQRKVTAIENTSLPDDIKQLNAVIEQRAKDIDEKNKEYKGAVERSLGGLSKMNIIGLAMSIYFGVEAEGVRKSRNEMLAKQDADIAALQLKNTILGSLSRVKFNLQNLATVVIDADVATQNLITVWDKLSLFIAESAKSTTDITDALSLRMFMTRFRQVVKPWDTIEKDADALLEVFKDADDEFKRIYGH
jgi:hypothetical protein